MKVNFEKIKNAVSWIVLIAMICTLIFTVGKVYQAKQTGESVFLFGYRPVVVLTGSMEPYMMTNSIAITKEVTSIDELEVDDVVTYHQFNDDGRLLRITHRIIAIDGDTIYTKGDNNYVSDGYPLTIDNIEAEVVCVFNQTAWLAAEWQTTTGKIMIISFTLFVVFLYMLLSNLLKSRRSRGQEAEDEDTAPEQTVSEISSDSVSEKDVTADIGDKTDNSEPPAL